MSLITDSDLYEPGLNQEGSLYIDQILSFNNRPNGLRCPCNNHTFTTRTGFATHVKSTGHKRWMDNLNANRTNYFTELEAMKKLVREQKIMIAQFQRDVAKLEYERRELMKTVHLLSDITRMPVAAATAQQQEMEDLMNFE
jgi:hypothetical protein